MINEFLKFYRVELLVCIVELLQFFDYWFAIGLLHEWVIRDKVPMKIDITIPTLWMDVPFIE
jgi:hypothetical protein